jgi:DNA-binding SARP family transcriptional activator
VGDRRGGGWRRTDLSVALLAAARGDHQRAAEAAHATIDEVAGGPLVRWSHAVSFSVPVLVTCGQPARARAALDHLLDNWIDGYDASRPLALRAWLRRADGDAGAWDDLAAAWSAADDQVRHLVRREWLRLEPLLSEALSEGVLTPDEVVAAIEGAWPGGERLLTLTEHPLPAVRRAALRAAASSGRTEVGDRLRELAADQDAEVAAAAAQAVARRSADPLPLVFRTLGGFELRRGSWAVDSAAWGRPAVARLVRFLLVHRDGAADEELFEAFWPGRSEAAARRSLQVAVSRARTVLDAGGDGSAIVAVPGGGYRLALRDADQVDADEFIAAADRALRATGPERRPMLESAAALWRGTPLPDDRWEPWAAAWRERLEERMGDVLAALTAEHREQGDHAAAAQTARRHAELDPLNELAHQELMLAYARTGRRAHALRQFLACRRALVDDLGVEPSQRTRDVHARILAGEPV